MAALADPIADRDCAPYHTDENESGHRPFEYGCVGDAQNSRPKLKSKQANYRESNNASQPNGKKKTPFWITESTICCHHHGEWEGRGSEAPEDERPSALFTNFALKITEALGTRYLLDSLLTDFPCDEIEQQYAKHGAASRRKHINDEPLMMARDQADNQQIVAKREKKERRIQHAHDNRAGVSQLKQNMEQVPEKCRQK